MINLLKSLLTVIKHLFIKPVTLEYPEKKRPLSDNFRGRPNVIGCVGCGICKRVCPSNAISYNKDEDGKVNSYTINLEKCIFCGNCMYYCPNKAISMSREYELGTQYKDDLKLNYMGGEE